jgi:hypothetical protein
MNLMCNCGGTNYRPGPAAGTVEGDSSRRMKRVRESEAGDKARLLYWLPNHVAEHRSILMSGL